MLDRNICWTKLPWTRMNLRILMIQRQIYIATKKCDFSYLQKLQEYLINSNDAKLISINRILDEIYIYNINSVIYKYFLKSDQKFNIFKYLLNPSFYQNTTLALMTQKIKQYLVYLSIQPTWQAKLNKHIYRYYYYNFSKTQKVISNVISHYAINNNHYFIKLVITKFKQSKYINQSINYWLNQSDYYNSNIVQNIFQLRYGDVYNYNKCLKHNLLNLGKNYLYLLISEIMMLDVQWFFFSLIQQISNNIKSVYLNFKIISIYSKYFKYYLLKEKNCNIGLLYLTRLLFYRKNYLKYLKFNVYLHIYQIIYRLRILYNIYFMKGHFFFSRSIIRNSHKIINAMIYFWLKKKNLIEVNGIFNRNILVYINHFVYYHIYRCNIHNYYIHYF
uniref:Reverse transcriptase N-terminal domain-containing protein n=1 Tax=Osmundaria fimbriata TaxID=228265 RepID=A0A1Z1M404_OSMFI|nr:hypothetical protein [Osmundaria fimbriata]ARW60808.1 hypothetical protein [Osmundaria fimbriata]